MNKFGKVKKQSKIKYNGRFGSEVKASEEKNSAKESTSFKEKNRTDVNANFERKDETSVNTNSERKNRTDINASYQRKNKNDADVNTERKNTMDIIVNSDRKSRSEVNANSEWKNRLEDIEDFERKNNFKEKTSVERENKYRENASYNGKYKFKENTKNSPIVGKNEKENSETTNNKSKNNSNDKSKNKFSKAKHYKSSSNAVTLDEIREALGNRVNKSQKRSIAKNILTDAMIWFVMALYLVVVIMGSKNIAYENYQMDIKILTMSILAIGILILEFSYKKDDSRIALNGIEVVVFAGANLCLIYAIKLYFDRLMYTIGYIALGITVYYILKSFIMSFRSVRKFKRDNNDIKDIVKKKSI